MKIYYLSKSEVTKDYYLDYGAFDSNREFLGKLSPKDLADFLFKKMPLHKKVLFYIDSNLEDSLKEVLSKTFEKTRYDFKYVRDLRKIKQPKL